MGRRPAPGSKVGVRIRCPTKSGPSIREATLLFFSTLSGSSSLCLLIAPWIPSEVYLRYFTVT